MTNYVLSVACPYLTEGDTNNPHFLTINAVWSIDLSSVAAPGQSLSFVILPTLAESVAMQATHTCVDFGEFTEDELQPLLINPLGWLDENA